MGFKEDLLFSVTDYIVQNWDSFNGNVEYFAERVRKSGLTAADLSDYLVERGKICPVCVTTVFDHVVNTANAINNTMQEGGAR